MEGEQLQRARSIVAVAAKERIAARTAAGQSAFEATPFSHVDGQIRVDQVENPSFFEFDEQHQSYDIYWGGYEYVIELDRIRTPLELLSWVHHLLEKEWELTTPRRIGELIEDVSHRLGWSLHGV